MKRIIGAAIIASLPFAAVYADSHMAAHKQEAKKIIKAFMGELKGELKSAMKDGGPVNAIDVCHKVAPAIAKKQSDASGWQVGRTSLKYRNPDNAPDAWEQTVLEGFESRKAAGEDPKKMMHADVVEQDGKQVMRVMKAIPTGKVCLNCHGQEIKEPVKAKLDEFYPNDRARGFQVGDIRGAFTLSKEM